MSGQPQQNHVESLVDTAFRVTDLRFAVEGRELLKSISLDFETGKVTGLVGHNGSGKSTLLKLLARQQAPASGRITFGNVELSHWGQREFARQVAYLPQDMSAAHGMTVRELVACGRYPWHGALGRFTDTDAAKVAEALHLTDIETMADRMVDTLSGGERQRAWIAMLVAQDSQCLLLDEPTSALDIAHQMDVLSLIQRLSREKGLSVIIVLHDINMAARFCDHVHALKQGAVVASGSPHSIMREAVLNEIYGIDMSVMPHPGLNIPIAYVC